MTSKILIVDDETMNRHFLKRFISTFGYDSVEAGNGREALERIYNEKPDLVILDINMPEMDGFSVLEKVKSDPDMKMLPFIVITGLGDEENHLKALELGADDFLSKPFNIHFLKARINSLLIRKRLYDENLRYQNELKAQNIELLRELIKSQEATIVSLATLAEFRDPETGEHLERMRNFTRVLAEALQKTEKYKKYIDDYYVEQLFKSSPLHDIGKVGIPDAILLKPGKLTDTEFAVMKTHTIIGGDTIKDAIERVGLTRSFLDMAVKVAYYHHEKWDGTGYPRGLKNDEIPLSARITTLADVYDALTSKRVYKPEFPHEKAKKIIVEGSEKHFDPDIVYAFLKCEEDFKFYKEKYRDKKTGDHPREVASGSDM